MTARSARLAGMAGIVFAIGVSVANLLPGQPPALDASADEIREFWVDQRGMLLAGMFIQLAIAPLFVWFLAGLWSWLRGDEGDRRALALAALIGGLVTAVLAFVGTALGTAPTYLEDIAGGLEDGLVVMLWVGSTLAFLVSFPFVAVFTGATALAGGGDASFPRWHVALGLLVAIVAFVAGCLATFSADIATASFIAFILMTIWILATSILLARGRSAVSPG